MRAFFIVIAILALTSCANQFDKSRVVQIYYIPFAVETYAPVTMANIESQHLRHAELHVASREYNTLMVLLRSSDPGTFDNQLVRVKILRANSEPTYVDRNGGMRRASSEAQINALQVSKLDAFLQKITDPRQPRSHD